MIGDEYYHWKETTDNQIVILSENGYYEYATIRNNEIVPSGVKVSNVIDNLQTKTIDTPIATREQLITLMMNKRSAVIAHMDSLAQVEKQAEFLANTRNSTSISMTEGNQKVLCILVEYPDRRFSKSRTDFENMWNQTNYDVEGSMGSIKEFYAENSYGRLNVTATVVGPYMVQHDGAYYATHGQTLSGSNVHELVTEALIAAQNDINFSDFDINSDNYVDAIHIVCAGYAQEAYESYDDMIWSHHSSLTTSVHQNGYHAKDYFITSELAEKSGSKIAPIGTVCHEYGHQLGAPDYYSVTQYGGTGFWDIMGLGNWNGGSTGQEGRYPAHHNPYTKAYIFNWTTPTLINPSVSNSIYTLTPSYNTTNVYRINTSTNNEFFLLENNRSLINSELSYTHWYNETHGGLIIYHIHKNIENAIAINDVNFSYPHKCYVVNADATSNPTDTPSSYGVVKYNSAYPNNDKIFFTSNSTPSATSWAGVSTSADICLIERNGNDINFVVNPQINGPEILSMQSSYSVSNIPSNAQVKWTYTFTPTNPFSQAHRVWKPIVFVNGNSTASVLVERGKYPAFPIDSIITGPMLPGIKGKNSTITYVYFSGTAVLKATITSGGYSYSITKTITLSSSSTTALLNDDLDTEEENSNIYEDNSNVLNTSPLLSYNLRHTNPVSSNSVIVHIETLLESNDVYADYNGNYTIEIWHDQLGLVKRITDNVPYLSLDCGEWSNGIYQMVLIVNGQAVAQSKLLKL